MVQVAHYGPADIPDAVVRASLQGVAGGSLHWKLEPKTIKQGGITDIGSIPLDFSKIDLDLPKSLTLEIKIEGTEFRNRYRIWVFPAQVDTRAPDSDN